MTQIPPVCTGRTVLRRLVAPGNPIESVMSLRYRDSVQAGRVGWRGKTLLGFAGRRGLPTVAISTTAQADAVFQRALALHRQRRLDEAKVLYQRTLQVQPRHFHALHQLGVIALQSDDPKRALDYIGKSIKIAPNDAGAHANYGNALFRLQRYEAALASYDKAAALRPMDPLIHYNRANAMHELQRYAAAVAEYGAALALDPNYATAYNNRGNSLREMQQYEAAIADYDRAIAVEASFAAAHFNRGKTLADLRSFEAAIASLDRAIELQPNYADAHLLRGNALLESKQYAAAVASYDKAIEISPDIPDAHINRGNALQLLRDFEAAIESYDRAIALVPHNAEIHSNRGGALLELKQFAAAIESFDTALALNAGLESLRGMRLDAKLQICDWSDFDAELSDLAARIERGEAASNPGFVLTISDSAALQRKAATNWIRKNYPPRADLPAIRTRGAFEKLKIGYFSADYRNHPVAQLTAGLFETHDRSKFEVIGFSFGPDTQDEMRKRMERAFDRFLDLRTRSAPEVASLARDMQLDIAVDLGGFTEGSSLEVFARRAAPLQVEFLGYPGTVGAPYIDYLIADRTVIPESAQVFYTEQIAYLPNCFQPNEAQRQVSPRTPSRADCGLPDRGFVFCCFNNHFKITPAVFAVWMRLLRDVGGSVLWLADGSESMKHNLRRSAATSGVAGDRLLFAPRMPDFADHLARLRVADLFLDTLPYNAHTTASNALGAGLPLLTCQGTSLAARVASSLLTVLELPELIATNLAQYEAMARRLAARPELLRDLRERLARNQRSAPLFDTERYCRGLEAAYLRMWRRRLRGELPASFAVEEPSPG